MTRPEYEAFDKYGLPLLRAAQVIGELPTPEQRLTALAEATVAIAAKIGIEPIREIKLKVPVFFAFNGMTLQKSKHHPDEKLLLVHGCDVPLDFCPSYKQPEMVSQ